MYAVWDRLVFPSERASTSASFHTSAFRGPVWFARTTNGGTSWEAAREIYDPGQNDQTIGNQIVVLPDGTLVDIFNEIHNDNSKKQRGYSVRVMRSTDQWSHVVGADLRRSAGDDLRHRSRVRRRRPDRRHHPDVAVAPNGDLYAVWQDARVNGGRADGVALSRSTDGGLTWSPRIKVNKTPTNIPIGNQQAFTPSVDVAADGTVAVTYYDFQNNTDAEPLLTDYWAVHCHTACNNAANWGDEVQLTDESFDMRLAPFAGGFFTGDYEGLASAGNDFGAFFGQTHGTDPGSIFFRRVGP